MVLVRAFKCIITDSNHMRIVWAGIFFVIYVNGKLRDELLNREVFYTPAEAKILIHMLRRDYNETGSDSAPGYQPPAP